MQSIVMLIAIYAECNIHALYAKCHYAECNIHALYAKCPYAECLYAEC